MQQHGRKTFARTPPPDPEGGGHVAYQIKGLKGITNAATWEQIFY